MNKIIVSLLAIISLMVGCSEKPLQKYQIRGIAQGTTYNIIYLATERIVTQKDITTILDDFNKSCSLYDSTSLICRINNGSTNQIDSNIRECLTIAMRLSKESNGMYDITVKPLVEAYGFAASDGGTKVNIDSLLQYVGYEKISFDQNTITKPFGVQIDLNSIAQGYSVDIVAAMFDKLEIKNYLVEIGGEVFAKGKNIKKMDWNVAIDKPVDGNMQSGALIQTLIPLSDKSLCTSGNYRKFHYDSDGNRINHTLNPKTGMSITTNLLSATIMAPTAAEADAYATMMMALGTEKAIEFLKQHPELGAYLVYSGKDNANITYEQ